MSWLRSDDLLAWAACVLLFVALVAGFIVPARAHEWLPIECCSGYDCQPYPETKVKETPSGYLLEDGKLILYKDTRLSQDQQFWRCPVCFFSPRGGT